MCQSGRMTGLREHSVINRPTPAKHTVEGVSRAGQQKCHQAELNLTPF